MTVEDAAKLIISAGLVYPNGKDAKKDKDKGSSKDEDEPSLAVRLGCDVQRQVARSEANAALINKRMEEALERQTSSASGRTGIHRSQRAHSRQRVPCLCHLCHH